MAKHIIILERMGAPSDLNYRYLLWADVPAARQRFYAGLQVASNYRDATSAELEALRSGAVVEEIRSRVFLSGTPLATMTAALEQDFNDFQSAITNSNSLGRYGSYWNGVTWTIQGVT
jgi:hypothetical protein